MTNQIQLQLIKEYGISHNRIVRAMTTIVLIPTQTSQDKDLLQDLIKSNDFTITNDSTDNAITDLLLLNKHKQINKEIENYINNLYY